MSVKSMIPARAKAHVKELLGIGRLEREIETRSATPPSAEARLKQLEDRLASVESVAGFAKNIDLMRLDDFFYFVYEDDTSRRLNSPDCWRQHTKLSPTEIGSIVAEARASKARRDLHITDPVARALWSLAKSGQPVNLIYVGCSYGFHLMKVADFVLKQNLNCRIVAFDPGTAGTLTAPTLRLNNFHNIEFFNVAASCSNSYAIMHQIVGSSEDNKLVNLVESPLRLSRLVETVSLDAFCGQHRIAGPTVLVIDTQGNEPDVVAGAASFLKDNVCVIVSEFTPWALGARMLAQDYIAILATYGQVYDLGVVEDHAASRNGTAVPLLREKVTAENRSAFTSQILNHSPHWTDVMVIPEDHDLGRLVANDFNVASL